MYFGGKWDVHSTIKLTGFKHYTHHAHIQDWKNQLWIGWQISFSDSLLLLMSDRCTSRNLIEWIEFISLDGDEDCISVFNQDIFSQREHKSIKLHFLDLRKRFWFPKHRFKSSLLTQLATHPASLCVVFDGRRAGSEPVIALSPLPKALFAEFCWNVVTSSSNQLQNYVSASF